ncbi:Acetoacetyl-CoA synthetase, partial [Stegodyphus mimosarum]
MVVNQQSQELHPKIVYHPKYTETQLVLFTKFVEKKYGIQIGDYWNLQKWSVEKFPEFWECVWEFFYVKHSQPFTEVYDRKNDFLNMEWFKDARLNYAENILKYRDPKKLAIIATGDHDNVEYVTYEELYTETKIYAAALKDLGVKKNDVVTCYMANKKEAVFAFLATASIGALWCGALPLLGPRAVLSRFQQLDPKVLFTAGNFIFEGNEILMDEKIPQVVAGLPTLQKVVYVPRKDGSIKQSIKDTPKCCTISEFLKEAREKVGSAEIKMEFEQLPFDHPFCISFTSGTTGLPKGLIHSQGMFFASLKDYGLMQDCTQNDTLLNFSPAGWISWNMFVNCLHLGLTLVMYEGDPFTHSKTRFWDVIDKFGINSCYIWSSTVDDMEKQGQLPTSSHSLKSLRQIFPMGSPAKPNSFDFLAEKIKPGLFCCPAYGQTEFFGLCSGLDRNLPVYRGEIQAFSLGVDVHCLDDKGKSAVGVRGDLVVAKPYPALPIKILGDKNKEKMKEMYFSRFPGYFDLGDDAWLNPVTKGFIVYGRGDETMNPKGARFNCAEMYFALDGFPGIVDCVCVSHYNQNLDERVVLFVKMEEGRVLTDQVKEDIKKAVSENMSYEHVPDVIMKVP